MRKTAWSWFSKYIRTRDCLKTTGTTEAGRCFTCGNYKPIEELQAGHGIGGRTNGILFDEEIVYAQCIRCNNYLRGNYENFIPYLIRLYGIDWYEDKKLKSKKPVKIDYKEESRKWREKYKALKES